jgi:Mannosyltransferase (PIG-V)
VPATPGWHNFIDGTDRWDAGWFERIARGGYDESDASAAFFPGYPIAIRAITVVSPLDETAAALLISNAAFLGALIVLFALTTYEFSPEVARRTVLLLACFPASFFFLAAYSESMFLFASVLCFWWARRGAWGRAALAGLIAALTRSVGVLLVPALLVEAWSEPTDRRGRAVACSLIPLLSPVAYAGYWLIRSGDALQPFHAQDSWYRTFELPLVTLGHALWLGISGITDSRGIYWTADLLLTALILIPLALRWRVLARPYLVYVVATLLVILSYPLPERPLLSAPRFLIVLFPAFWPLAAIVTRERLIPVVAVFLVGFTTMAIAFMNWGFVF